MIGDQGQKRSDGGVMTEVTHTQATPGPWEATRYLVISRGMVGISSLIAPAQTMLSALKVVDAFGKADEASGDDCLWTSEYRAVIETVRDAIAEADGRIMIGDPRRQAELAKTFIAMLRDDNPVDAQLALETALVHVVCERSPDFAAAADGIAAAAGDMIDTARQKMEAHSDA